MTVNELKLACEQAITEGHGDVPVLFDTEARKFRLHLIDVDWAGIDDLTGGSGKLVIFSLATKEC